MELHLQFKRNLCAMMTPFGLATETFSSFLEFYQRYPSLAMSSDLEWQRDKAPIGWDLVLKLGKQHPAWGVVFCTTKTITDPENEDSEGIVVAFNDDSGFLYELEPSINFQLAKQRYQV